MSADQTTPRWSPGQIPTDMKAFNQNLIKEFRANRGQLSGQMAGRSLLLLTTTGAKSRKERTAVLGFGKDGNRYVVIASGNGAPEHPAWYVNLLANPIATVEAGPEKGKGGGGDSSARWGGATHASGSLYRKSEEADEPRNSDRRAGTQLTKRVNTREGAR